MGQRVNRWIASCGVYRGGRASKLKQRNAGRTRNLRVFFFRFVARTQYRARKPRGKKNRRKIVPKRRKIIEKSILGSVGRFGAIRARSGMRPGRSGRRPGRARSPQERPGDGPGRPKRGQERLRTPPERGQGASKSAREAVLGQSSPRTGRARRPDRFSHDFSSLCWTAA